MTLNEAYYSEKGIGFNKTKDIEDSAKFSVFVSFNECSMVYYCVDY